MQFSIGDKVVHPHHGPGQITGLEKKELLDGVKRFYVIEIPMRQLTVYVPRRKMDQVGVRLAIPRARFGRVLDTLQSEPSQLPEDYKERQERVWEKLRTGLPIQLAEVVRDLVWRERHSHLTKKDSEYLKRGQEYLAAEMAVVSGKEISDVQERIEATISGAMASA